MKQNECKECETTYQAPMVEVIEVEVEKGFATSGDIDEIGYGGNY